METMVFVEPSDDFSDSCCDRTGCHEGFERQRRSMERVWELERYQ